MKQNNEDKTYPHLDNIGGKDGNTVPDNYFDTLASRVEAKLGIAEADDVPEGYFEELPKKVIEQAKTRETKVVRMPYLKYAMQIAAVFTLLMAAVFLLETGEDTAPVETMSYVADIDSDEALDYLSTYDDINLYQLVDEDMSILDESITDENEEIFLEEFIEELSLEQLDELL